MKGRRDNYRVNGMMILTVVIVFAVLAAVILGFEMLQKRQEKKISSAKNIAQNETTMEIYNETTGEQESTADEAVMAAPEGTDGEIIVHSQDDGYQIEETMVDEVADSVAESVEIVYLIKGDNKGSNKYARVDRLSYTDSVKYTEEQLACLDTYGLRITRNEIYARHGRMFNDQELQEYFTGQDWYIPRSSSGAFDESCLNEVEKYNAALIQSYELKQWD